MKSVPVPLAVASDRSQTLAFSSQRLINMYPERSKWGGKSGFVLLWVPGLKPFASLNPGPWRGHVVMAGLLYVVVGTKLYSLTSAGVSAYLGAIPGTGYVTMATVGTQVAIANEAGAGFIYDSSGPSFAQITDPDFFGGTSVTALDSYFIWSSGGANPRRFQISAINNGLSYDALDFAEAESSGTALIRCYLVGTQLFMMKSDRIEIWYDSGNADFPFERLNSTIIQKGVAAKFSPALLDNTVFWLGRDDEAGGDPIVYRANGYVPEVISTPAVARAFAGFTTAELNEVRGCSYVKNNHAFYGLIPPTGNSWWYDASEGEWSERNTYGQDRWLGNGLMSIYGKTLVGSAADGSIYELDQDTFFDNNTIPQTAEVTLPAFGTDPDLKRCSRLRLDMEAGVGLSTGQGSDPKVTLTVSDDRGFIYSSDREAAIGKIGQHGWGVEWRQLGQFRSRVHRFRITDPVKRALIACYADIA
jgi:hypothetical protein